MSRLFEAAEAAGYPRVYRGELSRSIFVQQLRHPYAPLDIGNDIRAAEDLRDALTAFLEGEREQAK